MTVQKYRKLIVDTLQGRTAKLREIPPERLDWEGVGSLLALYRQTSGKNRSDLIQAIGAEIEDGSAPKPVLAQLIQIASSLDLSEVEPQIRELQSKPVATDQLLRDAITNFLTFRQMSASPEQPERTPRAANNHANGKKAQSHIEQRRDARRLCD
jgi:hypothetical protein